MCLHYREPSQRPSACAPRSTAIIRGSIITLASCIDPCWATTEQRRVEERRVFGLVWIWFCSRSCDFVTNRGELYRFVTSKFVYRPLKVAGTCELCEDFLVIQVMVILSACVKSSWPWRHSGSHPKGFNSSKELTVSLGLLTFYSAMSPAPWGRSQITNMKISSGDVTRISIHRGWRLPIWK